MQTLENLTNKHYLSLAAIMLLAHMVPLSIKNSDIVLTDEENIFVNSYVALGKMLVYILVGTGTIWLLYLQTSYKRLPYISTIGNSIILLSICISIYAILKDTIIYQDNKINFTALKTLFKTHLLPGKK